LDKKIAKLRQSRMNGVPSANGRLPPASYDRAGTWNEKIRFILVARGTPMTTGEILEEMLKREPDRQPQKNVLRTSISATLSIGVKSKKYRRKANAEDDFEYSLGK
jgi:hypothetical protein